MSKKITPAMFFRGTFTDCLEFMKTAPNSGPFLELYSRVDTGGACPGVLCTAGPTDYADLEHIKWHAMEYTRRVLNREKPGRDARTKTTTEALALLREWGYDPDLPVWDVG